MNFCTKFLHQSRAITLLQMREKLCVTIPTQFLSISMHTRNLVKFYQFVLKILSRNKIMREGQTGRMMDRMTDNPNPVSPHFFKEGL